MSFDPSSSSGSSLLLIERRFRVSLASILGATLPLVVSCGTTTPNTDGGADASDEVVACGGCNCPDTGTQSYSTTYTVCGDADAGMLDAGDDAATDAGQAEAGTCYATCTEACQAAASAGSFATCLGESDAGATRTAQCESSQLCTGRRPAGLAPSPASGASLGATLAHMAWLEAASVHAFRRLARELRAHGAPTELVRAARDAARDEIRHTRLMRAVAERHGGVAPAVVVERATRDLESIALENAVEACVVETLGAVLAAWQSERAASDDIRAAMRVIAPDELRHAALGWAVAAWIEPRLSDAARAGVEQVRREATGRWGHYASISPEPAVAHALGLPNGPAAKALADAMITHGLWRRAA